MKPRLAFALLLTAMPVTTMAATRTTTLDVPGMTCPTCPITIRKSLEKMPGVDAVTWDVNQKTVTVKYDDAKTEPAALARASADAGYPATIHH